MSPCRLISYTSMIYRSIEYGDWVFAVEFGILHVRQNAITHSQYWRSAATRGAGVFLSFLLVDFQCTCFMSFHLPYCLVLIEQMIKCIKRVTWDFLSVWCRKIIRELLSSYSCEKILYSLPSSFFANQFSRSLLSKKRESIRFMTDGAATDTMLRGHDFRNLFSVVFPIASVAHRRHAFVLGPRPHPTV